MIANKIPAAQYLRMSTDHQQYSLDNQADAILQYAERHGFTVVRTFSDEARSGLSIKRRNGLKQLLKETMEGHQDFRAILVYDVSRWGRFQDADEAAHYEFMCRSSGTPVYYCAETFSDVDGFPAAIMKALKRTMAGEYSRELSVKVRGGLFRLATLGFKLGGSAVYGLRRQLLDGERRPKQLLEYGQRKSLVDDRVILVPGPAEEIAVVQRIFRHFTDEHRSPCWIAAQLNSDGVPFIRGAKWKEGTVRNLLKDSHYVGVQVWGRTSAFLSGPVKQRPAAQWAVCPKAFAPIVPEELFVRAQQLCANLTIRLSDDQLLERLRQLLKAKGRLSGRIIDQSRICPGLSTYYARFGGLTKVYALLGYDQPETRSRVMLRQRVFLLRSSLVKEILDAFPGKISEVQRSKRFLPLLRYRKTGLLVSVLLARCCSSKAGLSWLIEAPKSQRKRTTVMGFLDATNTSIESLTVVSRVPLKYRHFRVRRDDNWRAEAEPLTRISDLSTALDRIRLRDV
jgi:DNA invertase Pin-like site-specific DNA recombinase